MTEEQAKRQKLTVLSREEPKEVGTKGAKKLQFRAKDETGKELAYFTFRTSLFEEIQKSDNLDAEVTVKRRDVDGNTYIDHQISQLFVNGQPIGASGSRGGGGFRQESPEQRESIEAQVAFKGVIELMVAKVIGKDDALGKAALTWAGDRLSAKQPQPALQPTSAKPSPAEQETEPPTLVTPDTLVKLEKRIVDSGYTAKEANGIMINKLKWPQITGWSKLTEDQAIYLIEYLEKNPKPKVTEPENIPF